MAITNPVPPLPPATVIVAPVPAIKQAKSPAHVKTETTRAVDAAEKDEGAARSRAGRPGEKAPGEQVDVTV